MKQGIAFMLIAASILWTGTSCRNSGGPSAGEAVVADIVIYGGTSAAVTAAVQAARMDKEVVVVSPDMHLGGMSSSGLGWTDTGDKSVIGGLAREFYHRLYLHYQEEASWKWQEKEEYGNRGQGNVAIDGENRTMWIFEPHAAEKVFDQMIGEQRIRVYRDEWLDTENGITSEDGAIVSLQTLSGKVFRGKVFIDATYEGDLMAAAGVSYTVGREGCKVYGEQWNGVQTGVLHHSHHFKHDISPYVIPGDPSSGVLPRISTEDPGSYCSGDRKVQAYCFRLCLTTVPENRVEITRPKGYDSTQYALLVRVFETGWRDVFHKFDPIPNGKTDVNNHGPFSFDNIGMNYDYPEGSYSRRREIIREHISYQKGLLYFLKTDPRVPPEIRQEMSRWGYARDEFADNGHWPYNIYVRESRRMIGNFVMTEHHVLGREEVTRSIGMGSYTMDSHNTQRYIKPDGFVQNEGDIGVKPPEPYRIDMNSILPVREQCSNMLVPVCLSCSHIAFGSIRMEPVFMILGQSAATLACLAIEEEKGVHQIPYGQLRAVLLQDGQVLEQEKTEADEEI
ncbi:MAG: FAD-dependent oxidoreductase [Bacteroidota bacterium]